MIELIKPSLAQRLIEQNARRHGSVGRGAHAEPDTARDGFDDGDTHVRKPFRLIVWVTASRQWAKVRRCWR